MVIFKRLEWQKVARAKMARYKSYSYSKLAALLACGKSTAHGMLHSATVNITVENFLLICRYLEINPVDYIVFDEVQLKLF